MLSLAVSTKAQKILNDLYFSTCFKAYYHAALVKHSGYLVLSLVELGDIFLKNPQISIKTLFVEALLP